MNRRLLGAWCVVGGVLAGCTGLEPALIGAAITGTQTGVTLLSGAEVGDFREVSYEDTKRAVDRVGVRFGLDRLNEVVDDEKGRYWVYFTYAGGKLSVETRRRTAFVTSVEIDTRSKDQQGMATLFVEAVMEELEAIEAEKDGGDGNGDAGA